MNTETNEALARAWSRAVPAWTTEAETKAIRAEHARRMELLADYHAAREHRRRGGVVAWLVMAALMAMFLALCALWGA